MYSHEVTEQLYYNFHNLYCIYSYISFYIPIIIYLCFLFLIYLAGYVCLSKEPSFRLFGSLWFVFEFGFYL